MNTKMSKSPSIFVGTSGWYYSWNPEKKLEWYWKNSGLNTVELNASFYRFPFPNQIKKWAQLKKGLRWSIKVSKFITHIYKFSPQKSISTWEKFRQLFQPMDKLIDFYLFQAPPNFSDKGRKKIEDFIVNTGLGRKFAFEPRHISWFTDENLKWAKKLKITWVSIDAPNFPRTLFSTNGILYLRMHGKEKWYTHYYSDSELAETTKQILELPKIKKIYIYFNNDYGMLENAQTMRQLLSKK